MTICGDASKWAKVGVIFQLIGAAIYCSGYATNYWMASETVQGSIKYSIGLFKMTECLSGSCSSKSVTDTYKNSVFTGTMALATIVLIAVVVSTVMYCIYVASERARSLCHAITIISFDFGSVLFIVIFMAMWLSQLPTDFYGSWSLGLEVTAAGAFLIAGCLLISDIREDKYIVQTKTRVTPPPAPPPPAIHPPVDTPEPYHRELFYLRETPSPRPWDSKQYRPSPRPEARSPRTPQVIRVHMRSSTPLSSRTPINRHRQSPSYTPDTNRSSVRRYGTPKYSQRYDYRAR